MTTSRQAVIQAARRLVEIKRASESQHISPAVKEFAEKELQEKVDALLRGEGDG